MVSAPPRAAAGRAHVGISGWRYAPWRGVFYPEDLRQKDELAYAGRAFDTLEINGSFYSLQRPALYRAWRDTTPEGFVFAVKGPRYVTHMRRLKDVATPVANFFASGVLALEEKLGPILWQFPPQMPFVPERFETFFAELPRSTAEAARLAKKHDAWMKGRVVTRTTEDRPLRHAVEIRHPSFVGEPFVALLRKYGMGLVVADTAGHFPYLEDVTSDFVYIRLHGGSELYASRYPPEELDVWARKIRRWRDGGEPAGAVRASPTTRPAKRPRDVFVYFDNDIKVHAPYDALSLARRLGVMAPTVPDELRRHERVTGPPAKVKAVAAKVKPAAPRPVRRAS